MAKKTFASPDLGTANAPIDFGGGSYGYRQDGRWRYRSPETQGKFVEVEDQSLIIELEKRGYFILYPAHECIDRPELPCPACERDVLRRVRVA